MLEKIFPLLLLFGLGILLKQTRVLRKNDGPVISKLLISVVIPATIAGAISSAKIELRFLLLPLSGFVIDALLLLAAFLLTLLLGLPSKTKGAFLIAFPTLELGTVGYAVMIAAYGVSGLTFIALYDLGNALFTFSIVSFLASALGQQSERFRLSMALKQFACTPIIWSFAFGILLEILHIHIPMLSTLLSSVSQGLLFLIMVLVGLEFEPSRMSFTLPVLMIYLKTGIGITLGVLISLLFGFVGVERIAVILAVSVPPSLLCVAFAKENNLDVPFLASMCSIALPVAIGIGSLLTAIAH